MPITRQRIEQIVNQGCMDNEKWLLAQALMEAQDKIKAMTREHQQDLNGAIRGAQDEATWRAIQGDDYGSY